VVVVALVALNMRIGLRLKVFAGVEANDSYWEMKVMGTWLKGLLMVFVEICGFEALGVELAAAESL
jgi:hypothetical protein